MGNSRKLVKPTAHRLGNRLLQAVVDAGMMIALADGELEEEESAALVSLLAELSDEVSEEEIVAAMRASAESLSAGWEERIRQLSSRITSAEDRETVLTAAAVIMLADGDAEEGDEYELFTLLAEAFEVDQEAADSLLESVAAQYAEDSDGDDEDEEESDDDDEGDGEEESDGDDEEEDEDESEEEDAGESQHSAPSKSAAPGLKPTTLRRGDRGQEIRNLQSALNQYGFGLNVDGIFGAATEQAVRAFQANNGLRSDGLVGSGTRQSLGMSSRMAAVTHASHQDAAPAKVSPTPPVRRSGTSIGRGARGNQVTNIQSALANLGYDVSLDGIFGAGTERAVAQFQADNGLSVDGIVGPRTYAMLAPHVGAG